MRRLKWLLQIWFMWHITKVIKTHNEIDENENIFTVFKYPAANRDGDIIKYLPKICYDNDNEDDYDENENDGDIKEQTDVTTLATKKDNSFEILKMFKNFVKRIQKTNCSKTKSFLITTTMTTKTMPQAKNVMATSERSLRVDNKDFQQQKQWQQKQAQQQLEGKNRNRVEIKPFSILEQLKLDSQAQEEEKEEEEKEKFHKQQIEYEKLQEQQQQQQHQLSNQENLLQLQQMQNMQHILETLKSQNLGKATKKKKKKKKKKKPTKDKKKKRKKKPLYHTPALVAQPAHVLFAQSFKPQYQQHHDHYTSTTTTKKPQQHHHHLVPIKKIKYILRKNTIFKKKKKEYLNHLKHVIYPFVKFIAFFTILNPFTLAVFLFSLISPVVFGFLGFIGLSFLIKPALSLLFGVKHTVNSINRKKLLEQRKMERLRHSRRPITIHKHYYQQRPLAPRPPKSKGHQRYQHPNHHRHSKYFNPLLPNVRHKLKKNLNVIPNFKEYKKTYP